MFGNWLLEAFPAALPEGREDVTADLPWIARVKGLFPFFIADSAFLLSEWVSTLLNVRNRKISTFRLLCNPTLVRHCLRLFSPVLRLCQVAFPFSLKFSECFFIEFGVLNSGALSASASPGPGLPGPRVTSDLSVPGRGRTLTATLLRRTFHKSYTVTVDLSSLHAFFTSLPIGLGVSAGGDAPRLTRLWPRSLLQRPSETSNQSNATQPTSEQLFNRTRNEMIIDTNWKFLQLPICAAQNSRDWEISADGKTVHDPACRTMNSMQYLYWVILSHHWP